MLENIAYVDLRFATVFLALEAVYYKRNQNNMRR